MKRWIKRIVILVIGLGITAILLNIGVVLSQSPKITTIDTARTFDADCILVLGAGVRGTSPSPMLLDRLNQGIALYEAGASDRLLMSGDHGQVDYDEVNVMKRVAIDAGIPSSQIFMDHAGFSTYESLIRARDVFDVQRVIIVSQKEHLYRALMIADMLGLEAIGVAAEDISYGGQWARDLRESIARIKDLVLTPFEPQPTYLGPIIPISGDGDQTNDSGN
jgi:vancomycin permeability regulator SanA